MGPSVHPEGSRNRTPAVRPGESVFTLSHLGSLSLEVCEGKTGPAQARGENGLQEDFGGHALLCLEELRASSATSVPVTGPRCGFTHGSSGEAAFQLTS